MIRERRTPPDALGPMLHAARERAGLPQSAVATAAGVRRAYVTKLEDSARCPSLAVAQALCVVLALDDDEAALLLGCAVDDAGHNHPARTAA
ncbi:helix-turn-helix domain-containing protein [Streptomyces sp. NBC_00986]|uniref:helix-turn-helix domain-containing protein n=1 Tax=Streptomyces sp. NBC_00986 TaxID=2903702 RepID=UPI00386AD7AB|nr:helix-turn-helix transcriptional regulator [Streptomyces sp. NBC_00986]